MRLSKEIVHSGEVHIVSTGKSKTKLRVAFLFDHQLIICKKVRATLIIYCFCNFVLQDFDTLQFVKRVFDKTLRNCLSFILQVFREAGPPQRIDCMAH